MTISEFLEDHSLEDLIANVKEVRTFSETGILEEDSKLRIDTEKYMELVGIPKVYFIIMADKIGLESALILAERYIDLLD